MAPDKHKKPPGNEGKLSLASPSNAIVASSDRPIRLENALKAFRDVLTDEERERLRDEMAVSRDAGQVIAFTAGLDLVDPHRRGKSIATRLHSILQTVLQFSQVVDTYVSSHPEIAALVWGSVRLAFTVLANFTSFFQTFSDLLNGFDTLTPQFKEYQILFPDSLPLRNSVYDFHSAIISCCTQVISSTRRTWSQQAWASLTSSFDTEIRPRVVEIREKAELVKGQAALAKAQDDSRRQTRLAAEFQQRKWNSLLLKLSSYDHASAFNHARGKIHRGTAEWVFSTSEFRDWHESADSRVLDMSGKIGSGKTILSYGLQDNLMRLLEESASASFEQKSLLSLFGESILLLEKTFLVVDGLDQCAPQERHALLRMLSQLVHMYNVQQANGHGAVKVLISARESIAIDIDRALTPKKQLRIGLGDTNADLQRYAEEILAEKRDTGQLVIGNEAIMDQIVNKLRTGGEGMFLWVFLTIEDICSCPTDEDIRQTLDILPRKLSDTFNRALGRILASQLSSIVDVVQKTFKWVATVRRPLTRWELGHALGVKILQKSLIKEQIINGTERLPGWCENLVQIEPGDETLRFFHHSIKTHLLDEKLKDETQELAPFYIDLETWDHQVGEVCLTYLNFNDFERAVIELPSNSLEVGQIAKSHEGRSIPAAIRNKAALNALPHTGQLYAARFLRRFLRPKKYGKSIEIPKGSESERDQDFSEFFSNYPFLLYATHFWFHHTSHFQQSTTKTWKLWEDKAAKLILEENAVVDKFAQQPPGFEKFDATEWLNDGGKVDVERIALHRLIIFADFVAHRSLLTHVLNTVHDRGHSLSPNILMSLLPKRRVFKFPQKREGFIRYENSHDGLINLILEFVACGGPLWPQSLFRPSEDLEYHDTCAYKPLHVEMARILFAGYSKANEPELHLLARLVTLADTRTISDAVETHVNMVHEKCIHEFRLFKERNIVDLILETGGSSSFEFARWVLDLHENCVGGQRYKREDWYRKLKEALCRRNVIAFEFYLKTLDVTVAENKDHCMLDSGLLEEIADSWFLPPDLRTLAISIAIPGVSKKYQTRTDNTHERARLEKSIVSGNWDVAVALSSCGIKLANRTLDDVLSCVSQLTTPRCIQGWRTQENATRPTLELCVRHKPEAFKRSGHLSGREEEEKDWLVRKLLYAAEAHASSTSQWSSYG
ncbi:hypothetical protein CGCSCA4_v003157 [Colletotrichum siamense]|uniref:NACHT domain-containing protein n=1 Tax=Colletotrichum siamense TaxID=690259 RepID=A0A9P5K4Y1_COLSI|nr:hypothetical protein CGCSCA4_v003157 [Colletotrichum siamense]KAF4859309.1 hypothetical protein CGCSCA2_v006458 [Colletotrichum siamense]